MTNHLISIIIPVYNVEKYLRKCVDSVLAQTYKNLEIILIDDGSTDNSGKVCDEYAQKNPRVKVIHKKNEGVAAARNEGLVVAQGEYIGFVDSDDYIKPQMYEKILTYILKNKADIGMCQAASVYADGKMDFSKKYRADGYLYNDFREWISDFIKYGSCGVTSNKLFRRGIIHEVRFDPTFKRAEDINFMVKVSFQSIKIVCCNEILYYYLQREASAVHQKQISYFQDEYIVWTKVYERIQQLELTELLQNAKKQRAIRAFKLAILIILRDNNKQYQKCLWQLQKLFHQLVKEKNIFQNRILRAWACVFGKYPKLTITLLRFPAIKQIIQYYIEHKK